MFIKFNLDFVFVYTFNFYSNLLQLWIVDSLFNKLINLYSSKCNCFLSHKNINIKFRTNTFVHKYTLNFKTKQLCCSVYLRFNEVNYLKAQQNSDNKINTIK